MIAAAFSVSILSRSPPGIDARVTFALRVAREDDIPALAALIPLSVRALQAEHYSTAQMDAALGPVFGVDRELIRDGTYLSSNTMGPWSGAAVGANAIRFSAATRDETTPRARCSIRSAIPQGYGRSSFTRPGPAAASPVLS